jgi:hypothetical protein
MLDKHTGNQKNAGQAYGGAWKQSCLGEWGTLKHMLPSRHMLGAHILNWRKKCILYGKRTNDILCILLMTGFAPFAVGLQNVRLLDKMTCPALSPDCGWRKMLQGGAEVRAFKVKHLLQTEGFPVSDNLEAFTMFGNHFI